MEHRRHGRRQWERLRITRRLARNDGTQGEHWWVRDTLARQENTAQVCSDERTARAALASAHV